MATVPGKQVEDSASDEPPEPPKAKDFEEEEPEVEFVQPLPEELRCPLCLQVLNDPTLTSCCGHHFCRTCIDRVIARNHVCPLCNEHGFQTFLDKSTVRRVSALEVTCRWKPLGCQWLGELGRLARHLDAVNGDCGFVEVECEFRPLGCVAKVLRKDLVAHRQEDVHSHLTLMSRFTLLTIEQLEKKLRNELTQVNESTKLFKEEQVVRERNYQEEREGLVQLIQQLEEKLRDEAKKRAELEESVKQLKRKSEDVVVELERGAVEERERFQQQLQEQQCVFERKFKKSEDYIMAKLEERLKDEAKKREELEERLKTNSEDDTAKLGEREGFQQQRAFETRVQGLEQELRQDFRQLTSQLVKTKLKEDGGVEEPLTQAQGGSDKLQGEGCFPFEFTMPNFSEHKAAKNRWISPPFLSHPGGYKLCIGVHPGPAFYRIGAMAVCSFKVLTEHDDQLKWPRVIIITIQALNQETGKWDKDFVDGRGYARGRPTSRVERSTAYCKFIDHKGLGPYVKNDCIHFRVTHVELE